jgi:hypothetical protein
LESESNGFAGDGEGEEGNFGEYASCVLNFWWLRGVRGSGGMDLNGRGIDYRYEKEGIRGKLLGIANWGVYCIH